MSDVTAEHLDHRSLALGGTFGAAMLVQKLADDEALKPLEERLNKALVGATVLRAPDSWALIFADLPAFQLAAAASISALNNQQQDRRTLLYGVQLIQLAERLRDQPAVRNRLGELLDELTNDAPESLAEVYKQSISHLGQRIQVTGSANALRQQDIANHIRSVLLCGVRMAWLWLRLGGKRRRLVFGRHRVIDDLQALRQQLPSA